MPVHIVHFTLANIDPAGADRFRNTCLQAVSQGATELVVHLSSAGGVNLSGFTLYNEIRALPVPVTFHNIGNVESNAVLVYLAGTTRKASRHSRFLLHSLLWGFQAGGTVDHARLREYVATLDNDAARYAAIFDERTQGAAETVDVRAALAGAERILSAEEAVRCGIAHEVADVGPPPEGAVTWWVS